MLLFWVGPLFQYPCKVRPEIFIGWDTLSGPYWNFRLWRQWGWTRNTGPPQWSPSTRPAMPSPSASCRHSSPVPPWISSARYSWPSPQSYPLSRPSSPRPEPSCPSRPHSSHPSPLSPAPASGTPPAGTTSSVWLNAASASSPLDPVCSSAPSSWHNSAVAPLPTLSSRIDANQVSFSLCGWMTGTWMPHMPPLSPGSLSITPLLWAPGPSHLHSHLLSCRPPFISWTSPRDTSSCPSDITRWSWWHLPTCRHTPRQWSTRISRSWRCPTSPASALRSGRFQPYSTWSIATRSVAPLSQRGSRAAASGSTGCSCRWCRTSWFTVWPPGRRQSGAGVSSGTRSSRHSWEIINYCCRQSRLRCSPCCKCSCCRLMPPRRASRTCKPNSPFWRDILKRGRTRAWTCGCML